MFLWNNNTVEIEISVKYIVTCNLWLQGLFSKVPYPLRNGWQQVLSWNEETLYSENNCSLRLNAVSYKEKMFFQEQLLYSRSQIFLISCYFTKIFVHLSVLAAGCYLSVHKLIRCDPANIYLFKVNSRNTRKRCEMCSKLTVNTIERRSSVFIIYFEHILHFF